MDSANNDATLDVQDCETASSELAQGTQICDAATACTSKEMCLDNCLIHYV